ncbi:MAG: hypothetical protein QM811_06950 [Pirellulales bacterium]
MASKPKTRLVDAVKADPQRDVAERRQRVAEKALRTKYDTLLGQHEALKRRFDEMSALADRKPQKPFKVVKAKDKPEATAIVVLSDWHCEEVVHPETVNGLNEFTPEIAKKRAEAVTQRALRMIEDSRGLATVRHLVVGLLGDFFSAYLHEELAQTNALSPLRAKCYAADLLERTGKTLLEHSGCDAITFVTCDGNHGRTTKKVQHHNRQDMSLEADMYRSLARTIQDKRVRWLIEEERGYQTILPIGRHRVRFMHGDSIKYQGGIGGMTVPVVRQLFYRDSTQPADHTFFGHLHRWTPGTNWTCNGSLIGYTPYAVHCAMPFQEPLQTFALLDHERGMTRVMKLFCD